MPLDRALALPPCMDLDMYVWANVLEGPHDMLTGDKIGSLPGLSRSLGQCGPVLAMAMMEYGPLTMSVSSGHFMEAAEKGFVIRKRPCPMWKIHSAGGQEGFGRTFPESLCKFLMAAKLRRDL